MSARKALLLKNYARFIRSLPEEKMRLMPPTEPPTLILKTAMLLSEEFFTATGAKKLTETMNAIIQTPLLQRQK